MHYFKYKKNALYCENVKISEIAEKAGTPVYIYSYKTFMEHFFKLKKAFSSIDHLICYSLKANSNISIVGALAKQGCGADVVSAGELYTALKSGIKPDKIVFAGVGKNKDELEYAIRKKILMINVESLQEAFLINRIANKIKKKVDIALRVNPDVDANCHSYVAVGKKESKFGISMESAVKLCKKVKYLKNINIAGIHMHIGSQIVNTSPYVASIKKITAFIENLRNLDINIKVLDIGGGMGIIYKEETPSTADNFAKAVLPILKKIKCRIIIEPGRFIIGNAGILVSRVLYIKKGYKKEFVIVDAGMNDIIRPSLYGAYHEILQVNNKNKRKILADVVGPICESSDFIAKNRKLPKMSNGDLIAVMGAGAYGFSMSSNYNGRTKPAEILVKGNKSFIIRKREKYPDLIRNQAKIDL